MVHKMILQNLLIRISINNNYHLFYRYGRKLKLEIKH
jgi:hypothetical protein